MSENIDCVASLLLLKINIHFRRGSILISSHFVLYSYWHILLDISIILVSEVRTGTE